MNNSLDVRVGTVTATRIKNGRVVVDVTFDRPGAAKSNIPFFQPFSGGFVTPREGQQIQIFKLSDKSYVAMFPLSGVEFAPTDMGEGELCFRFSDMTEIRVKKNGGGYDVEISADGNVNISANGSVTINGTDFDTHTHDYSWNDAGGSGTTGAPN